MMKPEDIEVGKVYERRGASRRWRSGEAEPWVRRRKVERMTGAVAGRVYWSDPDNKERGGTDSVFAFARWAHREVREEVARG